MAVIFSDNFNAYTFNMTGGWTTSGLGTVEGGCGYGNGIGLSSPSNLRWISCTVDAQQANHTYAATPVVSLRAIVNCLLRSATVYEAFYLGAPSGPLPGFVFILMLRPNGSISIRANNVASETLSPSAAGQFPNDGSPFALQWRMSALSATSVTVAVDINNSTVWTHTYTNVDNSIGTNQWSTGPGANFDRLSILGYGLASDKTQAVDNLEIDNSSASVSWSVPADTPSLHANRPAITVTSFILNPDGTFAIIGTNFRSVDVSFPPGFSWPFTRLRDPSNNFWFGDQFPGQGNQLIIDSFSNTQINGHFNPSGGPTYSEGVWCAFVSDTALCWEVNPTDSEFCFTIPAPLCISTTFACDDNQLIVQGSNLDMYTTLVVTFNGNPVGFTVPSVTPTQLNILLDSPFADGEYCVILNGGTPCCVDVDCTPAAPCELLTPNVPNSSNPPTEFGSNSVTGNPGVID